MPQDEKGDTSTLSILFLAGAIGIAIWFLTVVSDFIDSGVSPAYAVFFFVPICGVFLVVVVLAEVVKSLTGPSKNETELSGDDPSSKIDGEKEGKKQVSMKQMLVLWVFSIFLLVTILDFLLPGSYFLNN